MVSLSAECLVCLVYYSAAAMKLCGQTPERIMLYIWSQTFNLMPELDRF